jgi:hypothetical protein
LLLCRLYLGPFSSSLILLLLNIILVLSTTLG